MMGTGLVFWGKAKIIDQASEFESTEKLVERLIVWGLRGKVLKTHLVCPVGFELDKPP
jgi:hypothetical protein